MPRGARERLTKLTSDPALAALRGVLAEEKARAWIVGGALRDAVLRREVTEVDLAVDGDAGRIARRMEALGRGRAVLLSGERSPRVFRVAGRARVLDLAELEGGSIGADLSRRDFTANALALDLASGELLDPFGGLGDLEAKRLRLVAEKNLTDDPLRALRAARLLATHGLTPDRKTLASCRRAAPALARVARERVQAELDKLLSAPRAVPALTWAAVAGLFEPSLQRRVSARRAGAVARSLAPFDGSAVGRLTAGRRRRLRLALLARRLGVRAAEAGAWLRALRWGNEEAAAVGRLLTLADRARKGPAGDDAWRWLLEAGNDASDALLLLEASAPESRPTIRRLSALDRRRGPIPDVRGADILEWLGIPPGPEVGRLLEDVRVEALAGRVATITEARAWLRRRNGAKRATGRASRGRRAGRL